MIAIGTKITGVIIDELPLIYPRYASIHQTLDLRNSMQEVGLLRAAELAVERLKKDKRVGPSHQLIADLASFTD